MPVRAAICAVIASALAVSLLGPVPATPPPVAAATETVDVDDNFYSPATVTVNVGDTVTWEWVGSAPHTVTANDSSFQSAQQTAGSFTHTFNAVGTFSYFCEVHGSSMSGSVTVQQAATATSTTQPATNTPRATTTASATPRPTETPAASVTASPATPTPAAAAPIAATVESAPTLAAQSGPSSVLPAAGQLGHGDGGGRTWIVAAGLLALGLIAVAARAARQRRT